MVKADKHKKIAAKSPDIPLMVKYYYSIGVLANDILDCIDAKFKKEFDDLDLMNVAMYTLHGIVCAETDDEKALVKSKICDMIDEPMNLNEWLFTNAKSIRAYDETFYNAITTGNTDNLAEKLEKAVEVAEYKAWIDEKYVLDKFESDYERFNINNGGA